MENASEAAKTPKPRNPLSRRLWVLLVGQINRAIEDFESNEKQKKPSKSPEEVTADATKWMTRFTFVLAAVGILTLIVLRNQLREMHEGGIDTHNLASAASDQAESDRMLFMVAASQAAEMGKQASETEALAKAGKDQAIAARTIAEGTKEQAQTSANQLITAERPWVSIDNLSFTKRLTFDKSGASANFTFNLRNTGNSPALAVSSKGILAPVLLVGYPSGDSIADLLERYCKPSPQIQQSHSTIASPGDQRIPIFPGEKPGGALELNLSTKEIAKASAVPFMAGVPPSSAIPIAVIVCVDYEFSFAPGHHQSRYAWQLVIPAGNDPKKPSSMFLMQFSPTDGVYDNAGLLPIGQTAD